MKILQMHNRYVYPGGEDAVAQSEAAMLRRFGHQVIEVHRDNNDLNRMSALSKINFYARDAFFSKEIYRYVRRIVEQERPDVAHAHNSFFVLGPAAYEACFDTGIPVVQTLHNYRFMCAAATFYRDGQVCEECVSAGPWKGIVNGCWHGSVASTAYMTAVIEAYTRRKILHRIKRFIALSEFSRGKFIQGKIDPAKIAVKPNFLDVDPGRAVVRGEHILYAGALQPYKGIRTLLNAWKSRAWPLPLIVAGTGPLAKDTALLASHGVECVGQVSPERICELIKGALCVVVPSECYENFPRVIIEAYACGIPVVASRLGALAELVHDGRTGILFEPGDAEGLARCLAAFAADKQKAADMGGNGRRVFEERYQADINHQQLMQIYAGI